MTSPIDRNRMKRAFQYSLMPMPMPMTIAKSLERIIISYCICSIIYYLSSNSVRKITDDATQLLCFSTENISALNFQCVLFSIMNVYANLCVSLVLNVKECQMADASSL